MNEILQVRKSSIQLSEDLVLDTYTADQIDERGFFINYLSGRGTSGVIKTSRSTMVVKTMSQELKSFLGEDFTMVAGQYKMQSGGLVPVSLWKLPDAIRYWGYWACKATRVKPETKEAAQDILLNASLSLFQVMTDEAFGREYTPGKAQELMLANSELKVKVSEHEHNAASWKYLCNEAIADRNDAIASQEQAQKDLEELSLGMASPDQLEAENEYLKRILRQHGIDPYAG